MLAQASIPISRFYTETHLSENRIGFQTHYLVSVAASWGMQNNLTLYIGA